MSMAAKAPTIRITPLIYAVVVFFYFTFPDIRPFRLAIYLIPALLVAELIAQRTVRFYRLIAAAFVTYSALLLPFVISEDAVGFPRDEMIFLASSMFMFVFWYRTDELILHALLAVGGLSVVALLLFAPSNNTSLSLVAGTGFAETSLGLILPLVSIAYYLRGYWMLFAISIVVDYFLFKRIALFALLCTLAVDFFIYRRSADRPPSNSHRLVAAISTSVVVLIALNLRALFDFLSDFLQSFAGITVAPNDLSSGRYAALDIYWTDLTARSSMLEWLFGNGPGYTTSLIRSDYDLQEWNFTHLHNDWIRLLGDYGILGMGVAAAAFMWAMSRDRVTALIALYSMLVLLTDNILTYLSYWIAAAFVLRCVTATRQRA